MVDRQVPRLALRFAPPVPERFLHLRPLRQEPQRRQSVSGGGGALSAPFFESFHPLDPAASPVQAQSQSYEHFAQLVEVQRRSGRLSKPKGGPRRIIRPTLVPIRSPFPASRSSAPDPRCGSQKVFFLPSIYSPLLSPSAAHADPKTCFRSLSFSRLEGEGRPLSLSL